MQAEPAIIAAIFVLHAGPFGPQPAVNDKSKATVIRFGTFELDLEAERLLKDGRLVRLQPQPFKLLCLLANRPGKLVTREEIQTILWKDNTFVDFEQGVNFAIKQVRDALGDRAEDPVYIQTVPRRGYRFLAPVSIPATAGGLSDTIDTTLQKVLWTNIAELRLAEDRRRTRQKILTVALALIAVAILLLLWARR